MFNPAAGSRVSEILPGQIDLGFHPATQIMQDHPLRFRQLGEHGSQLSNEVTSVWRVLALAVMVQIILDVDMNKDIGYGRVTVEYPFSRDLGNPMTFRDADPRIDTDMGVDQ